MKLFNLLKKRKKNRLKKLTIVVIFTIVIFFLSLIIARNNVIKLINNLEYSKVIYSRNHKILRVYLNKNDQYIFPIEKNSKIPSKLEISVLNFEDEDFYYHHGIDLKSIIRAIYLNITNHRVVSGASTISMQTIRIMRHGKRNLYNKFVEAFYAFSLETMYSKDEILKLYLSNTPYGGNIRGYKGAIVKYFNKNSSNNVENLTWAEATTLAILPNAPSTMTSVKKRKLFIEKRNKLLKKLYKKKIISKEDYMLSILEEPPLTLKVQNNKNLFFSNKVLKLSDKSILNTTLDLKIQKIIENIVSDSKILLTKNNINNTGIIVIDTKSREVLGYYGGTNKNINNGKIDALSRKRNVGSTLKPFLYGLSMDKGILTSKTRMIDIPTYFNSFSPSNNDRNYRGLVRADKALEMSLNIPMVRLLKEYGVINFKDFFEKTNLVKQKNKQNYGLSMILGTYNMTPLELASLYTSLGNLGDFKPLKFLKKEDYPIKTNQLISKGAVYLTLNIMSKLVRPNINWNYYKDKNIFYWKTGTSYGERDGWAVGTNANYTILVWNGNLNNRPGTNLSGSNSSAPIMFRILNEISKKTGIILKPKKEIKTILVTKNGYTSKYLKDFNQLKTSVEVPINSVIKKDPYEKKVFIDIKTKEIVDSRNWKNKIIKEKLSYNYGKEINYYLMKNNKNLIDDNSNFKEISFIYPKKGMKIQPIKMNNNTKKMVKVLISDKINQGTTYDWYVNKIFLKRGNSLEEFLVLPKGENTLLVTSSNGNSASITFLVK